MEKNSPCLQTWWLCPELLDESEKEKPDVRVVTCTGETIPEHQRGTDSASSGQVLGTFHPIKTDVTFHNVIYPKMSRNPNIVWDDVITDACKIH